MSLNGYISRSDEINTDIGCWLDSTVYLKEYFLEPIEFICCHTIPEIYFDFNSHVITENSTESLGYLKELMVNNPDLGFELRGFISPKEHYSLSLQRASAVKSWLIENRIDENRLSLWWSSEKIKESQQKLEMSTVEAQDYQIVAITITKY